MKLSLWKKIGVVAAVVLGGVAVAGTSSAAPESEPAGGHREAATRVPQRVVEAWARNDATAVADVFTRDTEFVVGDGTYLDGRAAVRDYMAAAFAGPLKGTRVTATVYSVRFLEHDVAVLHTKGGILFPGETEVPPERLGTQVWVVTQQRGTWQAATYQNTRISPAG